MLKAPNSMGSGPIWPEFEHVRVMPVLVTCKFEKDLIKNNREKVDTVISQWALSVAIQARVLIQSAPKPYSAFLPVMLHIKFDKDWPTGLRDIQVQKCGIRRLAIGIL